MKKSSGKGRLTTIIAAVLVFALAISGVLLYVMYETVLKPADFVYNEVATGDGTGYYRNYYNGLNEDEKKIYSVILDNIGNMPESIEIPALGSGNLDNILQALSFDNPDMFFVGLKCSVYTKGLKNYFTVDYTMTKEVYEQQLKEAKDIAGVIIANTDRYTSVYEKELYVHDYLINHCTYASVEENANANTMYGCLVEGKASCEGYSRAFQYIMSQLDIDNRLVTGDSALEGGTYIPHMWNYVVLDGEGYFVDVTWDDPKSETSSLHHTYFNVNTEDILREHKLEQELPLTTSRKYNYFVYESAFLSTGEGEGFEGLVANSVATALQRGYRCVELRFSDAQIMAQAKVSLFEKGVVYSVFSDVGLLDTLADAKVYYSTDDKMNVICLYY